MCILYFKTKVNEHDGQKRSCEDDALDVELLFFSTFIQ